MARLRHFIIPFLLLGCGGRSGQPPAGGSREPKGSDVVGPPPKTFTILICTANVYEFGEQNAHQIPEVLKGLQRDSDDLVVFGLQETPGNYKSRLETQLPGFRIENNNCSCSNTLAFFARDSLQPFCKKANFFTTSLPQIHSRITKRNAIVLQLPQLGITIANTHLMGGRYDDRYWEHAITGRNQQVQHLIQACAPNIIMGDFNADSAMKQPLAKYWKGLLETSPLNKTEQDIIQYNTEVHKVLKQQGYRSTVSRDAVCPTTPFSSVVDWIYARDGHKHKIEVVEQGVVPAITQHLSDHNFPWVRIKVSTEDPSEDT